MAGHGSTAGMMAYGDSNQIAMDIGEYEVLPVVEEIPVICGVNATDPRRRMWHWLGKVQDMGFSGINNFPTHSIVDGHFRQTLEETGMSVQKEIDCVAGSALLFPPMWPWLHRGNRPTKKPKYLLQSYLHYMSPEALGEPSQWDVETVHRLWGANRKKEAIAKINELHEKFPNSEQVNLFMEMINEG